MGIELLVIGLLGPTIDVYVRRPPNLNIDGAVVVMDDGDSEPIERRTRGGRATFPGQCTRNLKFEARMPHPRPPHLLNPSASRDCSRVPVELWIVPR
jgi:hypothetical protein